jgi:hypothetical protein
VVEDGKAGFDFVGGEPAAETLVRGLSTEEEVGVVGEGEGVDGTFELGFGDGVDGGLHVIQLVQFDVVVRRSRGQEIRVPDPRL